MKSNGCMSFTKFTAITYGKVTIFVNELILTPFSLLMLNSKNLMRKILEM